MSYSPKKRLSSHRGFGFLIIILIYELSVSSCGDRERQQLAISDTIPSLEYENVVIDTINPSITEDDSSFLAEIERTRYPNIVTKNSEYDSLVTNYVFKHNFVEEDLIPYDSIHINDRVFYVTEGDILISRSKLLSRIWSNDIYDMFSPGAPRQPTHYRIQKSILRYDAIKKEVIKWKRFPVTFCFDRASFKQDLSKFNIVKNNFLKAVNEWREVSGVSFDYKEELDNMRNIKPGVDTDFVITYFEDESKKKKEFVATAFFPEDPLDMRVIAVYPAYWTTEYDKIGIFRHELGHIFGFRHEEMSKSRYVPIFCRKKGTTDQVYIGDTYDKVSVMHYFCGGNGSTALSFSDNDKINFLETYPK